MRHFSKKYLATSQRSDVWKIRATSQYILGGDLGRPVTRRDWQAIGRPIETRLALASAQARDPLFASPQGAVLASVSED
jgi:hypothetical protein